MKKKLSNHIFFGLLFIVYIYLLAFFSLIIKKAKYVWMTAAQIKRSWCFSLQPTVIFFSAFFSHFDDLNLSQPMSECRPPSDISLINHSYFYERYPMCINKHQNLFQLRRKIVFVYRDPGTRIIHR